MVPQGAARRNETCRYCIGGTPAALSRERAEFG
jgi:hypothetical protein